MEKSVIERFDLTKSSLIEASAGTGKTYTITYLILRLLLGIHNVKVSDIKNNKVSIDYLKPKLIEEILVVTFTNAATDELKRKILEKIRYARIFFEILDALDNGEKTFNLQSKLEYLKNINIFEKSLIDIVQMLIVKNDDSYIALNVLVNKYQRANEGGLCAKDFIKVLKNAETSIDKAPICTIHSFCNRILNQIYSFEAGEAFKTELLNSNEQQLKESIYNIWRKLFYDFKLYQNDINIDMSYLLPLLSLDAPSDFVTYINKINKVRKSYKDEADLKQDSNNYQSVYGYNIVGIKLNNKENNLQSLKTNIDEKLHILATNSIDIIEKYFYEPLKDIDLSSFLASLEGDDDGYAIKFNSYVKRILDFLKDIKNLDFKDKALIIKTVLNIKFADLFPTKEDKFLISCKNYVENKDGKDNFILLTKLSGRQVPSALANEALQKIFNNIISSFYILKEKQEEIEQVSKEIKYLIAIYMQDRIDNLAYRDQVMFNDDLLRKLDNALNNPAFIESGKGEELALKIRQKYPVALIDEFQDTDPVQFSIFKKIYLDEKSKESNACCYLIGDDKQAIYSFRNSDINSYEKAKRIIKEQDLDAPDKYIYRLDTNFRSTKENIESVNIIFGDRFKDENLNNRSAFVKDLSQSDTNLNIEYKDVKGVNEGGIFFLDGDKKEDIHGSYIQYLDHDKLSKKETSKKETSAKGLSKKDAEEIYTNACVNDILRCLKYGYIQDKDSDTKRKIKAKDITVLVSNANQNDSIQAKLKEFGIQSVYYSDRSSVISKEESFSYKKKGNKVATKAANAIIYLMQAMCSTSDIRALQRSLASSLLALDAEDYLKLIEEKNFEKEIIFIKECAYTWSKYGFQAAFTHFFEKDRNDLAIENSLKRYLHTKNGQRVISDLYQISEIIQTVHGKISNLNAQLRWFKDLIEKNESVFSDVEVQKRLESEQDQLKIYTIHKSKGLEFPIVFTPFLWIPMINSSKDEDCIYYDNNLGHRVLDISSDNISDDTETKKIDLTKKESLEEGCRLAYVALTRAKYTNFIYLTEVQNQSIENIPLMHLITRYRYELQAEDKQDNKENSLDNLEDTNTKNIYANLALLLEKHEKEGGMKCIDMKEIKSEDQSSSSDDIILQNNELNIDFSQLKLNSIKREDINKDFTISSFSKITKGLHDTEESLVKEKLDIVRDEIKDLNNIEKENIACLHVEDLDESDIFYARSTFAKGPDAGTFLHAILEDLDFTLKKQHMDYIASLGNTNTSKSKIRKDDINKVSQLVKKALASLEYPLSSYNGDFDIKSYLFNKDFYLYKYIINCINNKKGKVFINNWKSINTSKYETHRVEENFNEKLLLLWIIDIIRTPLFKDCKTKVALLNLEENSWLSELKFLMPVSHTNTDFINDLANKITEDVFKKDIFEKLKNRKLNKLTLDGFTTGTIDLVSAFKGKYYVMDYKSNYLGNDTYAYLSKYVTLSVFDRTTRYDIQFLLYTLALHRFLKTRIKDYDYDTHIGGICYLYLRGMKIFSAKDKDSEKNFLNKESDSKHGSFCINDNLNLGVFSIKIAKDIILKLDALFDESANEE